MLQKSIILQFFIITFLSGVYAQVENKDSIPETKKDTISLTKKDKAQEKKPYNLYQFGRESLLYIKQPASWKGKDWLRLGAVIAVTFSLMPVDKILYKSTQGEQKYYYNAFVVGGRVYGEIYSIGGVAAVFGCYGLIAGDDVAKKITIELLQAGIYSEALTITLKTIVGRARPMHTENQFTYHPFTIFDNDFHSMPSGHTTSAFALSTVMSRHSDRTLFKILAYVPAGLTMFSRIYQNKHWLSDEIPAAAIGFFVGNWVVDLHSGKRHRINVTSVYPVTISINLDQKITQK